MKFTAVSLLTLAVVFGGFSFTEANDGRLIGRRARLQNRYYQSYSPRFYNTQRYRGNYTDGRSNFSRRSYGYSSPSSIYYRPYFRSGSSISYQAWGWRSGPYFN